MLLFFLKENFVYFEAIIKERCDNLEATSIIYDSELLSVSLKVGGIESLWWELGLFFNEINIHIRLTV